MMIKKLIFVFVLLFVVPFAVAQECVTPPSGLVSWWSGDSDASDIENGNDGTLVNGALAGISGKVDGAFSLDGIDDFILIGNPANLQVSSGDFTVDAWVKFDSLFSSTIDCGFSGCDQYLAFKINPAPTFSNADGWMLLKQADNRFWFCFGGEASNGCTPSALTTVRSTTVAQTDLWYHLVAVKTPTEIAIYVNGVKEASKPLPAFTDTNSAMLTLGEFVNGLLDEVEIYNRALSSEEIQAIFNAGDLGKCKAVNINTEFLPLNKLGEFSSHQFEAILGTQPYTWSLVDGIIPSGMEFSSDGILSGIPTEAGKFVFTVRVTDAKDETDEKTFEKEILVTLPSANLQISKWGTTAVPGRVYRSRKKILTSYNYQ